MAEEERGGDYREAFARMFAHRVLNADPESEPLEFEDMPGGYLIPADVQAEIVERLGWAVCDVCNGLIDPRPRHWWQFPRHLHLLKRLAR